MFIFYDNQSRSRRKAILLSTDNTLQLTLMTHYIQKSETALVYGVADWTWSSLTTLRTSWIYSS